MERRFWWLDSTDWNLAWAKLQAVKEKQLSEWEWMSWDEDDFSSAKEAEVSLLREIGIPSPFSDGKVVCCQGLPTFHKKIAKVLKDIPEGILLVIMAPFSKTSSLYLKAKKLHSCRLDECEDISSMNSRVEFVGKRAEKIGVRLDKECCYIVAELCGKSHDSITNELKKLHACSEDGVVSRADVMQVCSAEGEAVIFEFTSKIVAGEREQAHEWLRRLMLTMAPQAIVGWLCAWARSLCLVASCRGDVENTVKLAGQLLKLEKVDDKRARCVQMYAKTGRFYHAARELNMSGRPLSWPFVVMMECHRLELATRWMAKNKDGLELEMHRAIGRMMGTSERLRPIPLPVVEEEPKEQRGSKKYEVINAKPQDH